MKRRLLKKASSCSSLKCARSHSDPWSYLTIVFTDEIWEGTGVVVLFYYVLLLPCKSVSSEGMLYLLGWSY